MVVQEESLFFGFEKHPNFEKCPNGGRLSAQKIPKEFDARTKHIIESCLCLIMWVRKVFFHENFTSSSVRQEPVLGSELVLFLTGRPQDKQKE